MKHLTECEWHRSGPSMPKACFHGAGLHALCPRQSWLHTSLSVCTERDSATGGPKAWGVSMLFIHVHVHAMEVNGWRVPLLITLCSVEGWWGSHPITLLNYPISLILLNDSHIWPTFSWAHLCRKTHKYKHISTMLILTLMHCIFNTHHQLFLLALHTICYI